jgi:hypothetical protein
MSAITCFLMRIFRFVIRVPACMIDQILPTDVIAYFRSRPPRGLVHCPTSAANRPMDGSAVYNGR